MATIDEIFNSMADEAAEAGHEYLVIDPETRSITVPESERIFGVEADADADRKYFMCPRFVGDGLDLASMFLTVNYRNAKGDEDGYLVDDVEIQGDYVTFSWQLWPKTVAYKGTLQFAVCADLPNTTHRRGPDWNTTLASGEVLEGLDPDRGDVEGETSDVVTQLRAEVSAQTAAVEAAGAAQVAKVQTEGSTQVNTVKATGAQTEADALAAIKAQGEATLASIPAEYTDLAAQVDKLTRDRAAAIVCQAEGELLQITDAGNDPLQGLRIFGKSTQVKTTGAQLLPITEGNTKTDRGLTQTVAGGVCTVKGTANSTAAFNLTLYGSYYNTEPVFMLQPGTYTVKDCMIVSSDGSTQKKYENTTFTLTEELGVTWVATRSYQPGEVVAETTYPMLCAGTEALPWEPYSGGVASPCPEWPQELQNMPAPVVGVYGKNLITSYVDTTKLHNGVTFTVNNDGSITVDGTATEAALFNMVTLYETSPAIRPGATYTISGATKVAAIQVYEWQGTWVQRASTSSETTFTLTDKAQGVLIRYVVNPNLTAENLTVYPMLRLASDADSTYEQGKNPQTLNLQNELPGIPVASGGNYTDAGGQQWICDEVDLARGVYVQRTGTRVLTGSDSEHWGAYNPAEGEKVFHCYLVMSNYARRWPTTLCDRFRNVASVWEVQEYGLFSDYNTSDLLYFSAPNAEVTDIETWKAWLQANPVTIVYLLAEPVETALTDAEIQAYLALQSNKPTTTVLNDAGAHMVLEYAADPKTYIDNKLAALIAANN